MSVCDTVLQMHRNQRDLPFLSKGLDSRVTFNKICAHIK